MGLGRCVVTHIICTIMKKKFHALWSLNTVADQFSCAQTVTLQELNLEKLQEYADGLTYLGARREINQTTCTTYSRKRGNKKHWQQNPDGILITKMVDADFFQNNEIVPQAGNKPYIKQSN